VDDEGRGRSRREQVEKGEMVPPVAAVDAADDSCDDDDGSEVDLWVKRVQVGERERKECGQV